MRVIIKNITLFLFILVLFSQCEDSNGSLAPSDQQGQGGSLARFTISNNYLYVVDIHRLITLDLENPMEPKFVSDINLATDSETIFFMKGNLFIGTQTGLLIYKIGSDGTPEFLSKYEHVVSCDPVIAQDTLAYVTLRSENFCQQGVNRLEVIDIRDLTAPQLVHRVEMINPHGLGMVDSVLYVTEGESGLKIFDVNAADDIEELQFLPEIKSFDVIPLSHLLIVTGPDGIYQYDISDPVNMKLLSKISIESVQ
ncbi:LVIVD repeat-containing protein [Fulvivirga ligni]|uniref:LVIVD repeat-containing protein n=1 Tax=Fulvivirga ligni TaxID=2904246 RepID=UPI001F1B3EB5|nr:hypothetical protein [Fulvivirga ligni]UII19977.1 hypothetical protein LVD16_19215 [Fulvivirga ligni]